jgi:hypothetical protein
MSYNQNGSANKVKWPKHITAEVFKGLTNLFVRQYGYIQIASTEYPNEGSAGMILAILLPAKLAIRQSRSLNFSSQSPNVFTLWKTRLRMAHPVLLGGRYCGEIEGAFCLFQIGMIPTGQLPTLGMNGIWKAFGAINKEVEADPAKYGFTTQQDTYWPILVRKEPHRRILAQSRTSKRIRAGTYVGALSEHAVASQGVQGYSPSGSFVVRPGERESIYVNTRLHGFGKIRRAGSAADWKQIAHGRLGITDGTDLAEVDLPAAHQ